jgi:hypothetical protein
MDSTISVERSRDEGEEGVRRVAGVDARAKTAVAIVPRKCRFATTHREFSTLRARAGHLAARGDATLRAATPPRVRSRRAPPPRTRARTPGGARVRSRQGANPTPAIERGLAPRRIQ